MKWIEYSTETLVLHGCSHSLPESNSGPWNRILIRKKSEFDHPILGFFEENDPFFGYQWDDPPDVFLKRKNHAIDQMIELKYSHGKEQLREEFLEMPI